MFFCIQSALAGSLALRTLDEQLSHRDPLDLEKPDAMEAAIATVFPGSTTNLSMLAELSSRRDLPYVSVAAVTLLKQVKPIDGYAAALQCLWLADNIGAPPNVMLLDMLHRPPRAGLDTAFSRVAALQPKRLGNMAIAIQQIPSEDLVNILRQTNFPISMTVKAFIIDRVLLDDRLKPRAEDFSPALLQSLSKCPGAPLLVFLQHGKVDESKIDEQVREVLEDSDIEYVWKTTVLRKHAKRLGKDFNVGNFNIPEPEKAKLMRQLEKYRNMN